MNVYGLTVLQNYGSGIFIYTEVIHGELWILQQKDIQHIESMKRKRKN